MDVLDYHVQARHQDQDDRGGEQDAVAERDRHRDHEPRLARGLEDHRGQPAEGGQRRQHDRSETPYARLDDGVVRGFAFVAATIGVIDHD